MTQPLTGYRIADFSHVMAGPFCSHFLRLLGADVIKVESVTGGDAMRYYGPHRDLDGMSPAFIAANVGKRSIALDLKRPEGLEVARRLVASADVVLENFRPGVMQRLGLGYEECRALRSGIVYCSVSGYGQTGPLRDLPAIDNIVQATSGMMAANGGPDDPPSRVGWPVVDTYTGTLAALAVLSALLRRERFGEGQYLDVAMLDASLVMLTSLATPFLVTGRMLPRTGDTGYSGSPSAAMYVTRDGVRISLGAVQNAQFFALCRALGRPDLERDPRFRDPPARANPQNAAGLRAILAGAFLERTGAEWEELLTEVDVPFGRVRTVEEVCTQEYLGERGLLPAVQIPGLPQGTGGRYVNAGFVCDADGPGTNEPPPRVGQHATEILQELGFAPPDVERLIAVGAVRQDRDTNDVRARGASRG